MLRIEGIAERPLRAMSVKECRALPEAAFGNSPIEALTPEEVQRLESTAERPEHRAMQLSLKLMLYCGVRPTEVTCLNPQRDIVGNKLIIRPVTSKTVGGRVVPLRCVRGIRANERCIPRNRGRRWKKLRLAAGVRKWTPDICHVPRRLL